MNAELDIVVLVRALPEQGLCAGDVGAVVHRYAGGEAFEVEFVTGEGATVAVATLEARDLRPVASTEILHTRALDAV